MIGRSQSGRNDWAKKRRAIYPFFSRSVSIGVVPSTIRQFSSQLIIILLLLPLSSSISHLPPLLLSQPIITLPRMMTLPLLSVLQCPTRTMSRWEDGPPIVHSTVLSNCQFFLPSLCFLPFLSFEITQLISELVHLLLPFSPPPINSVFNRCPSIVPWLPSTVLFSYLWEGSEWVARHSSSLGVLRLLGDCLRRGNIMYYES